MCHLRQYLAAAKRCRRCKAVFIIELTEIQVLAEACASESLAIGIAQEDVVRDVGPRILQLRKVRGLTQDALRSRSRMSRAYLCRVELGQQTPSLGTLEKLAEALEVTTRAFFAPRLEFEQQYLFSSDSFVTSFLPYLRQLDVVQRWKIIQKLKIITGSRGSGHNASPS